MRSAVGLSSMAVVYLSLVGSQAGRGGRVRPGSPPFPSVRSGRVAPVIGAVDHGGGNLHERIDPHLAHPAALARALVKDEEQVEHAVPVVVQPRLRDGAAVELPRPAILAATVARASALPSDDPGAVVVDLPDNLRERVAGLAGDEAGGLSVHDG